MKQFVRNLCAKIKVDRLSCFRTRVRQVFTAKKPSSSDIILTMKIDQIDHVLIKLRSIRFLLKSIHPCRQTNHLFTGLKK